MNERMEATVHGRVQMVMYRDFAMRKARGLALSGYVQNLSNGTVRVVAEGARERLEALLAKLHDGSLLARVETVDSAFVPATGEFNSFDILYD